MTQTVSKFTRAGYNGKEIICPQCSQIATVFHFSWSKLVCNSCRESVCKYDWRIV